MPGPKRVPVEERFWRYVDRRGPDECWPWIGGKMVGGYGQVWAHQRRDGAHRVSWELANQRKVPPGMFVCHSCDNRPCVNPAHLWVGTNQDNIRDCSAKGRMRNGRSGAMFCKRGHELTPENTGYTHLSEPRPRRFCRTCKKLRNAADYQRKKALAKARGEV